MQILKWETKDVTCFDTESRKKLESEGWEPLAVNAGNGLFTYRRPVGYIEVEEKVVKHNGEIKPEQIITKEVSFNLDEIFKSRKTECQ